MPIKTKRYFLEMFLEGDSYLAVADKRRFSTVDNQLHRFSEIIQEGRIDGWEILDNFPSITITPGSGFIDGFYVNTFNEQIVELSPGNFYIYAQRRNNALATVGPPSDLGIISYKDDGPPSIPSGFSGIANDSFSIILNWNDNTERDFNYYELHRSIDNQNFSLLAKITNSMYEDIVDEDTMYYYRLYAVDKSLNYSSYSLVSVFTPLSNNIPPNPVDVEFIPSESAFNILWKKPLSIPISKIDHYEISYVELNSDGTEISSSKKYQNSNKNLLYDRINDVDPGKTYKLTIKTIDIKSRESTGVFNNLVALNSPAPRDPEAIAYTVSDSPGGITVNLSWTDGDTPYDPVVSFRYRIYVKVNGQAESVGIDVPIGFTEEQISLYTFNLVEYFPIPENEIITFRITSVDKLGFESFGNFIRLQTSSLSAPSILRNVSGDFDPTNGIINIEWTNQSDTYEINLVILQDDLDDAYINDNEIVNINVRQAEKYVLSNVVLNSKYTVRLTPINIDSISGPTSVIVITTLIPGGLPLPDLPTQINAKAGDRQISLNWNDSPSLYTKYYNIYRKIGNISINFEDWELIDILPVRLNLFTDYGLNNDEVYSYYVTSTDIYGRESLHLVDGSVNLNFVESSPIANGLLTEPAILSIEINSSNHVIINWDGLLEEYDSFIINRSINNLHSWENIATLDRNTFSYTDIELPLIDKTTFYYYITKTVNDSDIIVQSSNISPENSIFIGKVSVDDVSMSINVDDRRDIKDFIDPLIESTSKYLLPHKHREIFDYDPERVSLNSELIITDWFTVDGKIFTTESTDLSGTSFIVKINDRLPAVFYSIDIPSKRLIFSEPIVTIDPQTGEIIGEITSIEVRVLGIEEVDNVLQTNRFNKLNAKQMAYGRILKEQLPEINHEGRIKEQLLPKRFLLEKYNNFNYTISLSADSTKNFGDGTTFYTVHSSEGQIESLFDFDLNDDGAMVGFNKPAKSKTTSSNLREYFLLSDIETSNDIANDYIFDTNKILVMNATDYLSIDKNTLHKDLMSSINISNLEAMTIDSNNNIAYILTSVSSGSHTLKQIDLADGSIFSSVSLAPGANRLITDIEYNGNNNTIYAVIQNTLSFPATHQLATITTSGTITIIGTIDAQAGGASVDVHLAFDENANIMYGINSSSNPTNSRLFTVDLSTASSSAIGSTGSTNFNGIAIDYAATDSDNIYGITTTAICKINSTTGVATVIGNHNISSPKTICMSPLDQSFFINPSDNIAGNTKIRLGNFYNFSTTTYLKFAINLTKGFSIAESFINFTSHVEQSVGSSVRLKISILDPSKYSESIDLSSELIKTIDEIGTIIWTPLEWNAEENSDNTSVYITELLETFISNNSYYSGRNIIFKITTLETTDDGNHRTAESFVENSPTLNIKYNITAAEVVSEPSGFQSNKCYLLKFEFKDNENYRWVRITTDGTENKPNPIINLEKRLRFRILTSVPIYLSLGIREVLAPSDAAVGDDGGTSGPIEWINTSSTILDPENNKVPIGKLIEASEDWQEIDIDLSTALAVSFENGNSSLNKGYGVLEHIAFTQVEDFDYSEAISIYLDEFQQISDLLVAGTSQGIQISRDFGRTWSLSRLTETPVHKFYQASNNNYLWAISANQVFLSNDPAFWFVPQGTTGIQYIHDITEDNEGNMYISSDKGVYKLDISIIHHYSNFRQTAPVNAFSTDCYALYHNQISSGSDEVWVSTESGLYKTTDQGLTWHNALISSPGFVIFQIINIGSISDPTIIACNRKQILRKLNNENSFQIIADFEEQHNIFDIWKIEHFDGRIYVSTSKGVFVNSLSEIFTPGISSIPFVNVFPGLNINGKIGIAFALDSINLGTDGEQLFIGQENRLMVAQKENSLSVKKEYFNKELPSFFVNNEEINIGYIYNAFNKVLCFREPKKITDVVYAAYLPRKIYLAINGGWAHNNPSAEVFVYKNGQPTWLDWKLDSAAILGELQTIEGKLKSINNLSDFNSLYPKSQQYLDLCISNILIIKSGGENNTPLINNETLTKFIDDYFYFLFTLSDRILNQYDLNEPVISLSGINRQDRIPGSRADLIEQAEDFISKETTNITIDTVSGSVDFLQAYALSTDPERRNELSFNKYDDMSITVFNCNLKNTGEFTHKELEDKLEDLNTGLTAGLQRVAISNFIKAGIFFEKQNHYMFDRYNVENIQSKFYSAYTSEWYDKINSTIDYTSILKTENGSLSRFATSFAVIDTEDPYVSAKFWIGTDKSIIEYVIDGDSIFINNKIMLDNFPNDIFVREIYKYQNSIYVVFEKEQKSHIYKTTDLGENWGNIDTINLPDLIYNFKIINGTMIACTESGIFYSDNSFGGWYKSILSSTDGANSDSPQVQAFDSTIKNIYQGVFLIAESNRYIYTSGQGIEFQNIGRIINNDCKVVNKIIRFKNLTFVATDKGLYNDGNSVLSKNVQFGLETSIEDSAENSAELKINDICSGQNSLYCCATNGKIYRRYEQDEKIWSNYFVPDFGPIHKIFLIELSDVHYLIVTSYSSVKLINVTPGIGVFG